MEEELKLSDIPVEMNTVVGWDITLRTIPYDIHGDNSYDFILKAFTF